MSHKIVVCFRRDFSRQRINSSDTRRPTDYIITTGNCAVYPYLVVSAYKWKRVILFYDDINFAPGAHSVINSSRIMSRSRPRRRAISTHDPSTRTVDPIRCFDRQPVAFASSRRAIVECPWIARRSKDKRWRKIQQPPPSAPRASLAYATFWEYQGSSPWRTLHCRSGGRKKAGTPGKEGWAGRENDVGVVAGRAENLIANTFHSPANFKPISSVYCQSQRAQNSSLSVRNEILPVVPFRRSPCPFDLHWRRLDNLRIPLALALLYLNANISFNAGERFTMAKADRRFDTLASRWDLSILLSRQYRADWSNRVSSQTRFIFLVLIQRKVEWLRAHHSLLYFLIRYIGPRGIALST